MSKVVNQKTDHVSFFNTPKHDYEIENTMQLFLAKDNNGEDDDPVSTNAPGSAMPEFLKEIPGDILSSQIITGPFDYGTPLHTKKVRTTFNEQTTMCAIISEAQRITGELNLGLIMGKWFYWNYNPFGYHYPPTLRNKAYCKLKKKIRFTPFEKDVFAVTRTKGSLPEQQIVAVFTGSERTDIRIAGVRLDFTTSLSYTDAAGNNIEHAETENVINSFKLDNIQEEDIYRQTFEQVCIIKIPAGTDELLYTTYILGQAYTSTEINKLVQNNNINEYALAMLDLRNEITHYDIPFIYNPLIDRFWRPSGGVKLKINLAFHEIENMDWI